jgi:hypothetical protein
MHLLFHNSFKATRRYIDLENYRHTQEKERTRDFFIQRLSGKPKFPFCSSERLTHSVYIAKVINESVISPVAFYLKAQLQYMSSYSVKSS